MKSRYRWTYRFSLVKPLLFLSHTGLAAATQTGLCSAAFAKGRPIFLNFAFCTAFHAILQYTAIQVKILALGQWPQLGPY